MTLPQARAAEWLRNEMSGELGSVYDANSQRFTLVSVDPELCFENATKATFKMTLGGMRWVYRVTVDLERPVRTKDRIRKGYLPQAIAEHLQEIAGESGAEVWAVEPKRRRAYFKIKGSLTMFVAVMESHEHVK